MLRASLITVVVCGVIAGCSNESEVPKAVAIATTVPAEPADSEVLIASTPSEATVLLKGAEVGKTPMKLLIRDDTNLVLQKEGYIQQALLLTSKSDPNIVVELVPSTEGTEVAVAEADVPKKEAAKKGSGKPKKKKASEKAEPEPSPGPTPEPAPDPDPAPEPAPEPKPKKPSYTTMQQLKKAIKAGQITKAEFSKYQKKIRAKRAVEIEQAKKDYKADKLTKKEFKEKVRAIKLKYEG